MKRLYLAIIFSFICITLLAFQFFFFEDTPRPFEKKDKVAKVSLISEPISLDPRKSSDGITSQFFNFCFDGLTRRALDNNIVLSLAKDVKISQDGREYVFLLREAYWSNGELITAYDFEKSWKKVLDPSFAAHNPDYLFNIKNAKKAYFQDVSQDLVGIEALDALHLRVNLEHPDPYFLELLTNKTFFPVNQRMEFKDSKNGNASCKNFVSSGPFSIKKWLHRNKILLKKNPYYWDGHNVKLDGVELYLIEDEMTQLAMYERGDLDWIGSPLSNLPFDALSKLRKSRDFNTFSTNALYYCCFNNEAFPLNNTKIRKALTLALNRQDLIDYVSQGKEISALSLLPRTKMTSSTNFIQDNDLLQARRLFQEGLEELNLKKENFPAITFSFPNIYSRRLLAQAIQQQWEQGLGIKIVLQSSEWQTFLADVKNGKFLVASLARGTHHLDPFYFLSLFKRKSQGSNLARWESKKYQDILEQIKETKEIGTRRDLINEAEKIFMEEMPIAPVFFPSHCFLKHPKLHNVLISPVGSLDFKWAYID